jgi:hypothetical protein
LKGRALRADAETGMATSGEKKFKLGGSWDDCRLIGPGQMGMEGLALCIAGVLCERDPSLLAAFQERVEMLCHVLDDRGDHEAAAMVGAFGRALVDPAYKRLPN